MAHPEGEPPQDRYSVELGDRGRIVIPAEVRRRLGLKEGDKIALTVEPDGEIRLLSFREVARRARGMFAHIAPGRSLVDELIAERREEARMEEEEA